MMLVTASFVDFAHMRYLCSNAPRGQQHSKMNGNQARKDVKAYSARNWTK